MNVCHFSVLPAVCLVFWLKIRSYFIIILYRNPCQGSQNVSCYYSNFQPLPKLASLCSRNKPYSLLIRFQISARHSQACVSICAHFWPWHGKERLAWSELGWYSSRRWCATGSVRLERRQSSMGSMRSFKPLPIHQPAPPSPIAPLSPWQHSPQQPALHET